jgi:hypothetical protein
MRMEILILYSLLSILRIDQIGSSNGGGSMPTDFRE